jgi:RND family efflux transporter MFP subunit
LADQAFKGFSNTTPSISKGKIMFLSKLFPRAFQAMVLLFVCFFPPVLLGGQEQPDGSPPAKIVVAEVRGQMVSPTSEFIGTVFFQEVSEAASEVDGLVDEVRFEDGQRIQKGQILVNLRSDLLQKRLQASISSHAQVLANLENATLDYRRVRKLYNEGAIAEQVYDQNRFTVRGLEKQAASLQAEVERLELQLDKMSIRAPFKGVVVKKHVDRGEWLAKGETYATIAKDDVLDILVNVPQWVLPHIQNEMTVTINACNKTFNGKVFAVIPKGDIATRTFPVKIRSQNTLNLLEGMEARVSLPTGEKKQTIVVPRDAVLSQRGETVVFAVVGSKAHRIPVTVWAYEGLLTALDAHADLRAGMKVVTKGNERLKDGQPVAITDAIGKY